MRIVANNGYTPYLRRVMSKFNRIRRLAKQMRAKGKSEKEILIAKTKVIKEN